MGGQAGELALRLASKAATGGDAGERGKRGEKEEKEGEKASLSRRMRWGVIVVSWFSVFMRNFKAIL